MPLDNMPRPPACRPGIDSSGERVKPQDDPYLSGPAPGRGGGYGGGGSSGGSGGGSGSAGGTIILLALVAVAGYTALKGKCASTDRPLGYSPWIKISVVEQEQSDPNYCAGKTSKIYQGVLTLYTNVSTFDPTGSHHDLKGIWDYEDDQGKNHRVELVGDLSFPYGWSDQAKFYLSTATGHPSEREDTSDELWHSIEGAIDTQTGNLVMLFSWQHKWFTNAGENKFVRRCATAMRARTAPAE